MEKLLRKIVKFTANLYYKKVYGKKNFLNYIPVSGKLLDEKELLNMIDASLDMWLTTGRFNDEFEKKIAKFLNVKYALSTNSGSSANLLAISALTSPVLGDRKLKKGDEVITTATCFPTTINPIIQNGLIPVFVDTEIGTYNIDVEKIEEAITNKTKAIFVAHTLGNCFELDKIKDLCEKYNLWLIEDSCDALGGKYNNEFVGTVGHIGTYSFYPAHHITMGEGGAIVTNDATLYRIIMSFRDWGRDCWCQPGKDNSCKNRFKRQYGSLPFGYDHKYVYSNIGYNLKITDWQAACGVAQLDKLDDFIKKRKANFNYLFSKLSDLTDWLILPSFSKNAEPSWFGFLIAVKPNVEFNKQHLVEFLEEHRVGTRQLFAGNILRQPMMINNEINIRIAHSDVVNSRDLNEEHYKMLPNTDFIMNNVFWIGVFPALGEQELNKISELIHKFVEEKIK